MRREQEASGQVCRVYLAPLAAGGQREQSRQLLRQAARAFLTTLDDATLTTLTDGMLTDGMLTAATAALADDDLFELGFSRQGKPFFLRLPRLHFSLSHSRQYWACGFGPSPLGLDVQWQQARVDVQRLARRFFHCREVAWLERQQWSAAAFCQLWTAKEAYAKFSGDGLSWQLLAQSCLLEPPPGLQLCQLAAPDDYSLCLCAARELAVEVARL